MSLDEEATQSLKRLIEREKNDLEGEKVRLDDIHTTLPRMIEQLSTWSGITQDEIISYAYGTKFHHDDVTINKVIQIMHTFFQIREREEAK